GSPDPGYYLVGTPGLATPAWSPAPEPVLYEGVQSRVTARVDSTRFFRLAHTNVVLESLWADSVTPAGGVSGQTNYALGTVFSTTASGLIRAVRVYAMAGEAGTHVARIWRNRDNTLVGGPFEIVLGGVDGWTVAYLPKAVALEPNVNYTVSVSTGQDPGRLYASSENVVPSPGGNGRSLRYPAGAGVFGTQLDARPTQTLNSSLYFRDVLFQPTAVASEYLITWELDRPVSYGRGGEGTPYELGTIFRSIVPGSIVSVRVFAISAEGGTHTATIWRNSDNALLGGPYEFVCGANGGVGASAWFVFNLPEPVAVEGGVDYTVSVSTGADAFLAYAFIDRAFDHPGGNGKHLVYPAGAGRVHQV
ncbi:DUF4082 domain-containing protein, partial [bacterium]|nr:DUF4082 domain-containing protein [bacterium]